jgi:hypothetical protein
MSDSTIKAGLSPELPSDALSDILMHRTGRQLATQSLGHQADISPARAAETRAINVLRGAFRTEHLKILRAVTTNHIIRLLS